MHGIVMKVGLDFFLDQADKTLLKQFHVLLSWFWVWNEWMNESINQSINEQMNDADKEYYKIQTLM